jgi:hypothetical protein
MFCARAPTAHFLPDAHATPFCQVDEQMRPIPTHPEAHLWPSEVVTLGLLHARKGVGNRPFSRWLTRDYRPLFPRLPERTRLLRLFRTHQDWTPIVLAAPTVLGGIDTYLLSRIFFRSIDTVCLSMEAINHATHASRLKPRRLEVLALGGSPLVHRPHWSGGRGREFPASSHWASYGENPATALEPGPP